MSNYTITTDFGAKDSLPSSNSAKVVRGSEFTTEFTNIQTAIATKADTAGDTFTGVVNFSADVAVNTNTLFVDVSEAKVGIGTASPASILSTSGTDTTTYSASSVGGQNSLATLKIQNLTTSADTFASIDFNTNNNRVVNRIVSSHGSSTEGGFLAFVTEGSGTPAERMRIDASGNVGIGTTSPDSKLDVSGVIKAGDGTATDGGTALSVGYLTGHTLNNFGAMYSSADTLIGYAVESHKTQANKFISTASNSNFARGALTVGDDLKFFSAGAQTTAVGSEVTMTERMRIDSSGNVGIGTTSPDYPLEVIKEGTSGTGSIGLVPDSDNGHYIRYGGSGTNNDVFRLLGVGDSERMRIDTSGNLLVGKTAVNTQAVGIELRNTGKGMFTASETDPVFVNRLSTDGEIVKFAKDGGIVGSIGVVSSDNLYIQGNSTHHGLAFGETKIVPFKNGAYSNALCDLGETNTRFKDLYLSGGVHLGGTATANKLDDYEEGTWTPTVYANDNTTQLTDGVHYNLKAASYTKIGQLVHLVIKLEDIRSTKDDFNFSVPFTSFDNDLVVGSTLGQDIGSESNTSPIFGRSSGRFEIRKDNYQFAYGTCQYRTNS